jgi:hypothetical protein
MNKIDWNHLLNCPGGDEDRPGSANPCLFVPECDSSHELASFVDELGGQLAQAPASLTLRFVGIHQMNPDPALLVYETIKSRPEGTRIVTEALSPLLDGSVLVWLAGDCRRIRSTAWLYFQRSVRRQTPLPWEAEDPWREAAHGSTLLEMDHHTVIRLLSHYLPIEEFADKVITPGALNEFCLLEEAPHRLAKPQPGKNEPLKSGKTMILGAKRTWFIDTNDKGGFTLKGGWPTAMMKKDPQLRKEDIGFNFPTKEALVKHLKGPHFRLEPNTVILDGEEIVRG